MIKKTLLLIGFFALGICNLVNGAYNIPGTDYDLPLNFGTNNSDFILSKNLTFGNEFNNNYVGKIITTNSSNNNFQYYFFRVNNKIYYIGFYDANGIHYQGYINKLCIKEGTVNTCNSENLESFYNGDFGNSFDIVNLTFSNNRRDFKMCFDNDTTDQIIYCINDDSGNNLIDSEGYTFTTMEDIFNNAPATVSKFGNGDGGDDQEIVGIEIGSNESAINYFEKRYGRDSSICYAGIDNLTTLYGSSVSYNAGSGLNLFQVYSGLYNNSDLDKVYVWLNSWLLNYEQWFYYDEPSYLSTYNSGTNQVDLYYDNLTFPFANNPVAIYFLASNISYNSEYSTMGSEVVSYCNLKINGGSFDDIIDQAVKNNINNYTEHSNINNGLNPDGTQNFIDFSLFGIYTGDAWVSSGIDIDFSGDTTLRSSIRNFFKRVDVLFGDTIETGNNTRKGGLRSVGSILPSYIVYGLLFVVLFRLLRRR